MVQSNDWFYAFDCGGIELFDYDGNPLTIDMSTHVRLYDAGKEADTTPGSGLDQRHFRQLMIKVLRKMKILNLLQVDTLVSPYRLILQ